MTDGIPRSLLIHLLALHPRIYLASADQAGRDERETRVTVIPDINPKRIPTNANANATYLLRHRFLCLWLYLQTGIFMQRRG